MKRLWLFGLLSLALNIAVWSGFALVFGRAGASNRFAVTLNTRGVQKENGKMSATPKGSKSLASKKWGRKSSPSSNRPRTTIAAKPQQHIVFKQYRAPKAEQKPSPRTIPSAPLAKAPSQKEQPENSSAPKSDNGAPSSQKSAPNDSPEQNDNSTGSENTSGSDNSTHSGSGDNTEPAGDPHSSGGNGLLPAPLLEPTPTPFPTATPTPVPEPTATPRPTATPVPTATPRPEPTATPHPTATPKPEPTSTPRPAPTATSKPEPTATPKPRGATRKAIPTRQITPRIPDELKEQEFRSSVRVRVEISAVGDVSVTLRESSGNAAVDALAIDALRRWRWKPALRDGEPVADAQNFRFNFEVR